jgi:hypothetical protein
MIKKIISGGQTGADRAALDVALKYNIPHSGWIPKGRRAEDRPLPEIYRLKEMPTNSYAARTEQNVIDSDGTLIIVHGKMTGGTDYTRQMTLKHKKELLGIDLNLISHYDAASLIVSWIKLQRVQVINVAGPRASEDPRIYSDVIRILDQVIQVLANEERKSKVELEHPEKGKTSHLPKTVNEAIERLIDEISLKDRTLIGNLTKDELSLLHTNLGEYIRNEFDLGSGNEDLMTSCRTIAKRDKIREGTASAIIIEELWEKLRQTHKLRVVK